MHEDKDDSGRSRSTRKEGREEALPEPGSEEQLAGRARPNDEGETYPGADEVSKRPLVVPVPDVEAPPPVVVVAVTKPVSRS